jgi:microcystin-dependent protein
MTAYTLSEFNDSATGILREGQGVGAITASDARELASALFDSNTIASVFRGSTEYAVVTSPFNINTDGTPAACVVSPSDYLQVGEQCFGAIKTHPGTLTRLSNGTYTFSSSVSNAALIPVYTSDLFYPGIVGLKADVSYVNTQFGLTNAYTDFWYRNLQAYVINEDNYILSLITQANANISLKYDKVGGPISGSTQVAGKLIVGTTTQGTASLEVNSLSTNIPTALKTQSSMTGAVSVPMASFYATDAGIQARVNLGYKVAGANFDLIDAQYGTSSLSSLFKVNNTTGTTVNSTLSVTGGWVYQNTNLNASVPTLSAGLALGYNYYNTSEADLVSTGGFVFSRLVSGTLTSLTTIDGSGNLTVSGTTTSNGTVRIGASGQAGSNVNGIASTHELTFSSYRDVVPNTLGAKIAAVNYTTFASPNFNLTQVTDLVFSTLSGSATTLDSTTEKMRLTAAGRLGLGTASPAYPLDVVGDIKASGNVHTANATQNDHAVAFGQIAGLLGASLVNIAYTNLANTFTLGQTISSGGLNVTGSAVFTNTVQCAAAASGNQAVTLDQLTAAIAAIPSTTIPPSFKEGMFMGFAGAPSTWPTGWILCDGSYLNRGTYNLLFAAIGTTYNRGESVPSNQFKLPDFRNVAIIGDRGSLTTGKVRGQYGGSETSVIGQTNLPPHTHTLTHNTKATGGGASPGAEWTDIETGGTATSTTNNGPGNSTPLSVLNPYGVGYWLIYAGTALGTPSAVTTGAPTLTSISPSSAAAGNHVTVTGTNFLAVTSFKILGSQITPSYIVNSSTQITFAVPSGSDGQSGQICVTAEGGTTCGLSFSIPAPVIIVPPTPVAREFSIDVSILNQYVTGQEKFGLQWAVELTNGALVGPYTTVNGVGYYVGRILYPINNGSNNIQPQTISYLADLTAAYNSFTSSFNPVLFGGTYTQRVHMSWVYQFPGPTGNTAFSVLVNTNNGSSSDVTISNSTGGSFANTIVANISTSTVNTVVNSVRNNGQLNGGQFGLVKPF